MKSLYSILFLASYLTLHSCNTNLVIKPKEEEPVPGPTITEPEVSWAKQFGVESYGTAIEKLDICFDIAIDSSGNIYAAGETSGNLGEANGGSTDAVIIKLDKLGNTVWIKQLGAVTAPNPKSLGAERFNSIAIDDDGSIYAAGSTASALGETFGGGASDALVVKFNNDGDVVWIKQFGGVTSPTTQSSNTDIFNDLLIDHSGNIYAGGHTRSNFAEVPNAVNVFDAFIVKLEPDGDVIWKKHLGATSAPGATGVDNLMSLAIDATGNIFVNGQTNGALGEANGGGYDAWFMKLNPANGNIVWLKQLGGVSYAAASVGNQYVSKNTMAVDPSGNIVFPISTDHAFNEALAGTSDITILKFNTNGTLIWAKQFGQVTHPTADNAEACYSLIIDTSGNIYCGGHVQSSFAETNSGGVPNPFVMKLNSSGDLIWARQMGLVTLNSLVMNGSLNMCQSIAFSPNGQVVCGGRVSSSFMFETNGTVAAGDMFFFKLYSDGRIDI